jgi:hypothetical protein
MLYLNKYNLSHRCSVNILHDIQNFPNHSNKRLNPQRKFRSADSTGHLNCWHLKVKKYTVLAQDMQWHSCFSLQAGRSWV